MNIKPILESLLFVNENPIELSVLVDVLEVDKKEIQKALKELAEEYPQRGSGMCIVQVAGGYQMCSTPDSEPWIRKMYREKNKQRLSRAALETMAIIAYKQPVTKMEIEAIRGVNIDGVMKHLLNWGLVKMSGRKEVIGRPFLYITTRKFLEYFGLNSIRDLPKLEEFSGFDDLSKVSQDEKEEEKNTENQDMANENNNSKNVDNETFETKNQQELNKEGV